MVITSVDNKKIKKYMTLKDKKGRDTYHLFLVEGRHLCEEAYKNGLLVDILMEEGTTFDYDIEPTLVTDKILKKLSSLTTYSDMIGIVQIKEKKDLLGNILLLDDIQNPGNLGTIIRSAKAFNIQTIVLSLNSISIYNDKVIRGSQGMLFNMNIMYADLQEVIYKLKDNGYTILATNVNDGVDVRKVKPLKYALIMGNEGHGVRKEIAQLAHQNLYIKMNQECESLNVAVATSILLYELNRGQNE